MFVQSLNKCAIEKPCRLRSIAMNFTSVLLSVKVFFWSFLSNTSNFLPRVTHYQFNSNRSSCQLFTLVCYTCVNRPFITAQIFFLTGQTPPILCKHFYHTLFFICKLVQSSFPGSGSTICCFLYIKFPSLQGHKPLLMTENSIIITNYEPPLSGSNSLPWVRHHQFCSIIFPLGQNITISEWLHQRWLCFLIQGNDGSVRQATIRHTGDTGILNNLNFWNTQNRAPLWLYLTGISVIYTTSLNTLCGPSTVVQVKLKRDFG